MHSIQPQNSSDIEEDNDNQQTPFLSGCDMMCTRKTKRKIGKYPCTCLQRKDLARAHLVCGCARLRTGGEGRYLQTVAGIV